MACNKNFGPGKIGPARPFLVDQMFRQNRSGSTKNAPFSFLYKQEPAYSYMPS